MNHCKFSRIHLREMKYREREEKYFVKIMLDLFLFFFNATSYHYTQR